MGLLIVYGLWAAFHALAAALVMYRSKTYPCRFLFSLANWVAVAVQVIRFFLFKETLRFSAPETRNLTTDDQSTRNLQLAHNLCSLVASVGFMVSYFIFLRALVARSNGLRPTMLIKILAAIGLIGLVTAHAIWTSMVVDQRQSVEDATLRHVKNWLMLISHVPLLLVALGMHRRSLNRPVEPDAAAFKYRRPQFYLFIPIYCGILSFGLASRALAVRTQFGYFEDRQLSLAVTALVLQIISLTMLIVGPYKVLGPPAPVDVETAEFSFARPRQSAFHTLLSAACS
ncbi:hypothetical protein DFJ77DRAFT_476167 [Powellomyces hirtus]|nr:hypothetical protein DFJ77DRAFT_476167 [Powellomyces hirtus]